MASMLKKSKKLGLKFNQKKEVVEDRRPVVKIFGEPLDYNTCSSIPVIISSTVKYFEKNGVEHEGLFRISGAASEMKHWMTEFECGTTEFTKETDVHVIASLLKQYLRDMPNPLIPEEFYSDFIHVGSLSKDAPTFIAAMKGTLQRMPEMFRIIFKYLITFLRMVSLKADINKMTPSNIAIVFAPNILRPKGNDIFTQMQDSGDANRLFEGLIGHCDAIFENEPDPKPINPDAPPIPRKPEGLFESLNIAPKPLPPAPKIPQKPTIPTKNTEIDRMEDMPSLPPKPMAPKKNIPNQPNLDTIVEDIPSRPPKPTAPKKRSSSTPAKPIIQPPKKYDDDNGDNAPPPKPLKPKKMGNDIHSTPASGASNIKINPQSNTPKRGGSHRDRGTPPSRGDVVQRGNLTPRGNTISTPNPNPGPQRGVSNNNRGRGAPRGRGGPPRGGMGGDKSVVTNNMDQNTQDNTNEETVPPPAMRGNKNRGGQQRRVLPGGRGNANRGRGGLVRSNTDSAIKKEKNDETRNLSKSQSNEVKQAISKDVPGLGRLSALVKPTQVARTT